MAHASGVVRQASDSWLMRSDSWLMRSDSWLMRQASGVLTHGSWLMRHASAVQRFRLMAHASGVPRFSVPRFRRHASGVMRQTHGSCVRRPASCVRLMAHASCVPLTWHASGVRRLTPRPSFSPFSRRPLSVMTTTKRRHFPHATAPRFAPVELYGMG